MTTGNCSHCSGSGFDPDLRAEACPHCLGSGSYDYGEYKRLEAENTSLRKRLAQYELAYSTLFLELAHSDDEHRSWLRDKITDHLRKYIEEGAT